MKNKKILITAGIAVAALVGIYVYKNKRSIPAIPAIPAVPGSPTSPTVPLKPQDQPGSNNTNPTTPNTTQVITLPTAPANTSNPVTIKSSSSSGQKKLIALQGAYLFN